MTVAVIGNLNTDLLLGPLAHPPAFGHETFVAERSVRGGGQAYYTSLVLAALGAPPILVADVGGDAFGTAILDDLRGGGVDVRDVHTCAGIPNGLSVALLNEQRDRAFITHLGHLQELDAAALGARWGRVAQARLLLFCGYFCLPGLRPSGGEEVLRRAQESGITTVLDTGWDPDDWARGGREEAHALLRHSAIFLPNLEEARALTGRDDPEAAARDLLALGPHTVIVKLGGDGALGLHGAERVHVPVLPTTVADTVGAGDAFNAGALYALAQGWPLADVLRLGIAVAGYSIGRHEPRYASLQMARELMGRLGA